MTSAKPVHTLVLDAGPIIKNEPPVSTLLNKAEALVTVPAILSEIRDAATRARVETTLRPFLTVRSPSPNSIQFVREFAGKTGDLSVLSQPDIQIIALTYEIECERNGGDWRLRRQPGQQRLNGSATSKDEQQAPVDPAVHQTVDDSNSTQVEQQVANPPESEANTISTDPATQSEPSSENPSGPDTTAETPDTLAQDVAGLDISPEPAAPDPTASPPIDSAHPSTESEASDSASDSDPDDGGWITPSNLKRKQAEDASASTGSGSRRGAATKTMQAAVLTTDFAMQNVILQMNLNLLSAGAGLGRIRRLRGHVLRCHACFQLCRDATKQFCPRCGGAATLTRVACSTSAQGEFVLHLKRNMQWNTRGDRYSIPKPVHGSANGKVKGGGKGGWGHELILAEDQKEYQAAERRERRQREKNLMDEDYLPGILTGDRGRAGGRVKVGAGRNVNSRKR